MNAERGTRNAELGNLLRLVFAVASLGTPLAAQDDRPAEEPFPLRTTRDLLPVPGVPGRVETVTDETSVTGLALEEAMALALENNLDLVVESWTPEVREEAIAGARSRFDPLGFWKLSRARSIQQGGNQLAGGNTVEQVVDRMTTGVRKTGIVGTVYEVALTGERTATNSSFSNRPVQYSTDVTLTLTQPLLRNLGFAVNRADLWIAENQRDQSLLTFQNAILDVLARTEVSYWNLVFARENLAIQRDSLRLSEEAVEITKIKVESGLANRIDLLDSQNDAAEARRLIVQFTQQLQDAEDELKSLVRPRDAEFLWNVRIVPTEVLPLDAARVAGESIGVFESVNHALANRPDLQQLRLDATRQNLELERAKNLILPKVDFEGSATFNALAASFEESIETNEGLDFFRWQAGLAVEIPFGNRAAASNYREKIASYRQALDRIERSERQIVFEVRRAIRAVESKLEEINAAKSAKYFAREKFEAERSRYQSGERTAFEVNEFQNDFIRARANEVKAFTEYYKALADLKKAEASSLETFRRRRQSPRNAANSGREG